LTTISGGLSRSDPRWERIRREADQAPSGLQQVHEELRFGHTL
jgi:hypothetical protein